MKIINGWNLQWFMIALHKWLLVIIFIEYNHIPKINYHMCFKLNYQLRFPVENSSPLVVRIYIVICFVIFTILINRIATSAHLKWNYHFRVPAEAVHLKSIWLSPVTRFVLYIGDYQLEGRQFITYVDYSNTWFQSIQNNRKP